MVVSWWCNEWGARVVAAERLQGTGFVAVHHVESMTRSGSLATAGSGSRRFPVCGGHDGASRLAGTAGLRYLDQPL